MIEIVSKCKHEALLFVNTRTIHIYYVLFSIEYWHATRTLWALPVLAAGLWVFTHQTAFHLRTFLFAVSCIVLKCVWPHSLAAAAGICAVGVHSGQQRRGVQTATDLPQTASCAPSLPTIEETDDKQRCFYLF